MLVANVRFYLLMHANTALCVALRARDMAATNFKEQWTYSAAGGSRRLLVTAIRMKTWLFAQDLVYTSEQS